MREIAQKLSRCSSFGTLMDDAFARCPEREAIVYEDWRLTYGDLERYIHQTAHYLRHLGVRKGSRVAILSRNCPEWIIAEFALYQLGAIVVKINWRLTPPEQARMLARNQVSVAFLKAEKPEWGAELERLCADSVRLIRLEPVDGRSALCALVSGEPDTPPDVPVSRDDVACRLHTSGTTGEPKCVVYTHGGMLREIVSMLQVYPYPDGQRYQFIAQLFHSAAIGAHLSLATGGTMVLKDHFALEDYMHTLVSERIESISVVPTVLKWILDETDNGDYDLSHLKTVNYSTCPIPKALLQRAIEKLHCCFYQSYGMTEMGSTVTALLPEDHLRDGGKYLSSVGRPIPGAAVRIVAPDGSDCPAGTAGEIYVRGQDAGISGCARDDARGAGRRLVPHERHGHARRAGVPVPERPCRRSHYFRRREHLSRRGHQCHHAALRRRGRGRGLRRAGRDLGRARESERCAHAGQPAHGGGAAPVLPRAYADVPRAEGDRDRAGVAQGRDRKSAHGRAARAQCPGELTRASCRPCPSGARRQLLFFGEISVVKRLTVCYCEITNNQTPHSGTREYFRR